ncbi:MAG TPA: SMI1/KNR4 family protein [Planctomycetaceae bacterium]|jgi:hypothetical protein
MDKLIARIKSRVADPRKAVDAAAWVHPLPTIRAPAKPAEVDAAERALGHPIPQLLRRLYLEVGNGGFGPAYGLEGVPTIPPTPLLSDIVFLYSELRSAPPPDENPSWYWPDGLVPLISLGCNIWECVDLLTPPYAIVVHDPNECDWERPLAEQLKPVAESLAKRLEKWLAKRGTPHRP